MKNMCGIVGTFTSLKENARNEKIARAMSVAIVHRGPDSDGFYSDEYVGMGFRRLSIIDLQTGDQPIPNEDSTVWTILNGEIYNYLDLRKELEAKGHSFSTKSDTEILVHLYEEYSDEMVHRLRGMFSFCIWDARRRRLLLYRDRLGIKPLFYSEFSGRLYFASEIKSILATKLIPNTIDYTALDHYMGLQYVPAPHTIYANIRSLKPGHVIIAEPNKKIVVRQYWDLPASQFANIGFEEASSQYRHLLEESVRMHMVSDVPLGAFLSGGVDSSAVVALMARASEKPIRTFTICHRDKAYDEGEYALAVSKRYGTRHEIFTLQPSDFLSLVPGLLEQYDEPFADSSALPAFMVSKLARKHVTVALSGDGGDETCAGYLRYAHQLRMSKSLIDWSVVTPPAVKERLRLGVKSKHGAMYKAIKLGHLLTSSEAERHRFFMSYFRESKRTIYGEALLQKSPKNADLAFIESYMAASGETDLLRKLLYLDQKTYLPDDILYKVDIASMANSLEVRVPLLDHKLVEFISRLPSNYKVKGNAGKYIFKKVLEDLLPSDVLYRKKKGFELPVSAWFRKELAPFIKELLMSSEILKEPFFVRSKIEWMLSEHLSGAQDFGPQLWVLMGLAVWDNKNRPSLSA